MDPGLRDSLIIFERGAVTVDDHGGETRAWGEHLQAWARVKYGTGQERREAAQERFSQAATFECEYSPALAQVELTDHILFDAGTWDITSKAPLGHREIHFTGIRSE